ncbi:hypothetical protein TNCV_734791 [Trichonephila clavipes]|nr:hypothetical protein TNCV_734791 [Trichonephila clavipes]
MAPLNLLDLACCERATGTSPDKTNDHDTLTMIFSSDPGTWPAILSDADRCFLGITLKPLSATRWESRIEAIKPLRYRLGGIYDSLFSVDNNAEIDNYIRDEAYMDY